MIQGFGMLLRDRVPKNAMAGRVGGEEFAVLLSNTHIDAAVQFAQAFRAALMTMRNLPRDLRPTVSVGIPSLIRWQAWQAAIRRQTSLFIAPRRQDAIA